MQGMHKLVGSVILICCKRCCDTLWPSFERIICTKINKRATTNRTRSNRRTIHDINLILSTWLEMQIKDSEKGFFLLDFYSTQTLTTHSVVYLCLKMLLATLFFFWQNTPLLRRKGVCVYLEARIDEKCLLFSHTHFLRFISTKIPQSGKRIMRFFSLFFFAFDNPSLLADQTNSFFLYAYAVKYLMEI